MVSAFEGIFPGLRQVQGQDRFIDLHPLHALGSEATKDFAINGQQALQQVEFVEVIAFGLAQPQVGQRADDHRFDVVPQGLGFFDFIEQLFPAQLELLVSAEFRDQVVIVGVEPLGQFLGVLRFAVFTAAAGGGGATGHGEQRVEGRQAAFVLGTVKTLGDHTEAQGMGQHLVVPGEVAHRQQINAGVLLQLPVPGSQFTANGVQRGLVEIALPIGFEGFFQFAVGANARKTEGVGQGHGE
ncbi:hypothetical protein D3C78_952620 [compost metagenome]